MIHRTRDPSNVSVVAPGGCQNAAKQEREFEMGSIITVLLFLAIWFALQYWILPRLGLPT